MTPTWAVLLVALGSGLLGIWLQISHERGAEIRTRMLDAADQFSTGVVAALQEARNAAGEVKKAEPPLIESNAHRFKKDVQTRLDVANQAVDHVLAMRARVHLLFGDQSHAGIAATGVVAHLRNMGMALEDWPNSIRDYEAEGRYSRNFQGALEQHEGFNRAARHSIAETWWGRFWARLQSLRRRE
jgi:hypothetical protein